VQTDPTNHNNKPDIIIHVNKKRTCVLINFAISGDRNVIKRVVEMILKGKYNRNCESDILNSRATGTTSQ